MSDANAAAAGSLRTPLRYLVPCRTDERTHNPMSDEKITVRATATGQTLDVVVLSKRPECVEIVVGEGVHSVRCQLSPNRSGTAYVGSVRGREVVYERSRDQVKIDIDRANSAIFHFKRR